MAQLDISALRTAIGIQHKTIGKFLDAFGVTASGFSRWQSKGTVPEATMERLCAHFGVPRIQFDIGARDIDQDLLEACILSFQENCDDAGVKLSTQDMVFWVRKLYQTNAGKSVFNGDTFKDALRLVQHE